MSIRLDGSNGITAQVGTTGPEWGLAGQSEGTVMVRFLVNHYPDPAGVTAELFRAGGGFYASFAGATSNNAINYYFVGTSTTQLLYTHSPATEEWQTVMLGTKQNDIGTQQRFYLNGNLVATKSLAQAITGGAYYTTPTFGPGTDGDFSVQIDEVAGWGSKLSAANAVALSIARVPNAGVASPKYRYQIDGSPGATCVAGDSSLSVIPAAGASAYDLTIITGNVPSYNADNWFYLHKE